MVIWSKQEATRKIPKQWHQYFVRNVSSMDILPMNVKTTTPTNTDHPPLFLPNILIYNPTNKPPKTSPIIKYGTEISEEPKTILLASKEMNRSSNKYNSSWVVIPVSITKLVLNLLLILNKVLYLSLFLYYSRF